MWMLWLEEHLVLKSADEQNTKRLLMTELCLCVLLTNPLFCLSRSTEQISLFYLNYILVVYFDYFIEPVFWQSWFKTICDLMQFFFAINSIYDQWKTVMDPASRAIWIFKPTSFGVLSKNVFGLQASLKN